MISSIESCWAEYSYNNVYEYCYIVLQAPVQESAFLTNGEVVSCHIDLGRELSIMHGILKEHIHKLSNVRPPAA